MTLPQYEGEELWFNETINDYSQQLLKAGSFENHVNIRGRLRDFIKRSVPVCQVDACYNLVLSRTSAMRKLRVEEWL